ncbi:hypothetical protein QN360_12235 [Glaciimonas sp. CA11.2]|uniref:hypothetical protein n=1 Tax=Glaciimonas sp. Gout2 TaxID=3048625 RepID=UPI002B22EBC4|nr:hypothetical protein [Glaciimonas sp. Gout2]MEB0163672.1 hypothetical protein [Glaciimonas sp. CA11.2]
MNSIQPTPTRMASAKNVPRAIPSKTFTSHFTEAPKYTRSTNDKACLTRAYKVLVRVATTVYRR